MAGKISEMTAASSLALTDLIESTVDPAGTPLTRKATLTVLQTAIATNGGAGLTATATKTSNYSAVVEDLVVCNTSGGAFTVTLPASPAEGDRIGVYLLTAGNNLTVGRNGKNIDGAASDLTISAVYTQRVLQYNGTQWVTVDASGQSVLASSFGLTADATFEDTGLSVALPTAGKYQINYNARGLITVSGVTVGYITARLYDATAAAAIASSERLVIAIPTSSTSQHQSQSAFSHNVFVTQAITLKLYAKRDSAGGTPSWSQSDVGSDAAGWTAMSYEML